MSEEKNYWRIIDFAAQVGKHYNTVDSWFKKLEEKRIHYIQRTTETDEKVYDQTDLMIAQHIVTYREKKWSLDSIFDDLPNHCELRPFPNDEVKNESHVIDMKAITTELSNIYEQIAITRFNQMRDELTHELKKEILRSIPQPPSRQERITDWITMQRIQSHLESEAIDLWMEKPDSDRIKKAWFGLRKEEDLNKRDQFIKKYVASHLHDRLQKEFYNDGDDH
ncbi:MerR family transcriptional regulator [Ammoniphilus sp. CFH 90114]|uniref:MerR family transcriptional regulator n=1 Tax=Ammoniphilus sp. CFH 90114 TaxID=2493665 RepID=UPI00100EFDBC|nr:MerR family transcriptional regulator [Ammoniphilus sp. CFH 90114]RXT00986.1 MerR family transcriptional regulator [Ammoniphilus sp. CFH 90114]